MTASLDSRAARTFSAAGHHRRRSTSGFPSCFDPLGQALKSRSARVRRQCRGGDRRCRPRRCRRARASTRILTLPVATRQCRQTGDHAHRRARSRRRRRRGSNDEIARHPCRSRALDLACAGAALAAAEANRPGRLVPARLPRVGSFCVPGQGAQDAIAKPPNGTCPHGWLSSGSYCLRARRRLAPSSPAAMT